MLTHIEISHYKSISHISLPLRPMNIIVGANGAGKSNIIDSLRFLHDAANDDLDTAVTRRHGIDSIRQWSKTKPYHISICVKFRNREGRGQYKLVLSSNKGDFKIVEESGNWYGPHPRFRFREEKSKHLGISSFMRTADNQIVVTTDHNKDSEVDRPIKLDSAELFLTRLQTRVGIFSYILFRPMFEEISSYMTYVMYPNTLRQPQPISRDLMLKEDGSNLSTILKRINSSKRSGINKSEIMSSLRYIMPNIEDVQVKSAAGFFVPVIRVKEENGDSHDFNLSQISDGTLRCLGLLAAFYQPVTPDKIAIEEPEQMIHPGALPVIAEAIRDFTTSKQRYQGGQTFITTHSPHFLDLFPADCITWAKYDQGATRAGAIGSRQMELIKNELFSAGEILVKEGFF